ncbi:hypothetical protein RclHR1_18730001 [Rhizophagus clarus]|uniref:Ubiquitin carboxyl-terminal hydrolase n=1 Tax=Rhizophagus clarus TaxID=94130 RepID=A0A2Z6QPE0_9GLOM|nr:hypothetical protein RclHR1_18730001 [Rhizophagus clarus]GES90797.1 cysteine proteinase [Rhizophagus clarus]
MHSHKEFKPIYGSFSGREDIEIVTKNTQGMPLKVPFNIGFPSIRRGGTKIKVTLPKPQECGKEQNVSYSQAVMRAKQITPLTVVSRQMAQANKIITQTSSTVITNGNRSSTLAKPSITTQVSLSNKPSVDRPSSQVVSSISNKSTSANIQSRPSSPDKYNSSYNATGNDDGSSSTSVNGTSNFSGTNCSTSKVPVNILNGTFQQNNLSNLNGATKPNSLNVHPQHKNGVAGKTSVWNGVNSKIINPIGAMKEFSTGSTAVRSQHTNSVTSYQRGNKILQYGPNTGVASLIPNNSTCTVEKMNTNNNFPKEPSYLNANVTKHVEQHESDNKNNTPSFTSTPSSSRRSSESNGTNTTVRESTLKNNAKHKKKNESKTSSGFNTPSQSNTPGGSRRSSTSHSPNTIVVPKEPSVKNVSARQVESDSKNNMSSVSNTPNVSRRPSESITSQLNSNGTTPSNICWAHHLFPKDENQKPNTVIAESSKSNTKLSSPPVKLQKTQKPDVLLTNGKPKIGGLAGLLKDFDPSFQNEKMRPRGLINNGNMCFMNAILQTLSHCPPFCNLLTRIYKDVAHSFNSKTPLVDSLVRFIEEYKQVKRTESSEEFGEAFSPEYVYDALRGLKRFDSMKGRQEDAEEFLGFLLDGLHEEFLAALKKSEPKDQQSDKAGVTGDDWMEVGRKNKTSFTRTTNVEETPISRIFGGQFRSVLTCPGSNDSITLQPYQSLQLDIQPDDVKTIGDALKNLTVSESVDDFYSPKIGLVKATKRLYIETLPPILTLHLKRFIYDNVGGTQKLSKHIGYSTTLSIQPEIVAQARRPTKAIEYRLFGVVYHHGKSATGGHYTADILCQNDWLHIDDTAISPISLEEVASVENPTQPTDRSAYILFYMRN